MMLVLHDKVGESRRQSFRHQQPHLLLIRRRRLVPLREAFAISFVHARYIRMPRRTDREAYGLGSIIMGSRGTNLIMLLQLIANIKPGNSVGCTRVVELVMLACLRVRFMVQIPHGSHVVD